MGGAEVLHDCCTSRLLCHLEWCRSRHMCRVQLHSTYFELNCKTLVESAIQEQMMQAHRMIEAQGMMAAARGAGYDGCRWRWMQVGAQNTMVAARGIGYDGCSERRKFDKEDDDAQPRVPPLSGAADGRAPMT